MYHATIGLLSVGIFSSRSRPGGPCLLTRQTIFAIEKEQYDPSFEPAFRIAQLFGAKIEDMFIFPPGRKPLSPPEQDIRREETESFVKTCSFPEQSPSQKASSQIIRPEYFLPRAQTCYPRYPCSWQENPSRALPSFP